MTNHIWCHGPQCHERRTMDRVRGSKGFKVIRTRKIKTNQWNANNMWSHFCSQGCWNDFAYAHWDEFIRLHPRPTPLETQIKDPKKDNQNYYGYWTIEKKGVVSNHE